MEAERLTESSSSHEVGLSSLVPPGDTLFLLFLFLFIFFF